MPKIKQSVLKRSCIRIGTVSTARGLRCLRAPAIDCDVIEVRVDSLRASGMEVQSIKSKLRDRKHPVLLTLRTTVEGGSYAWKSTERILVFKMLMPFADAVDLEIKNMRYVRPLLQEARDSGKVVILSSHSLQRKLTAGKADRLVDEFRSYRVDIYKLACLARTREDLMVLVNLLMKYPQLRLGVMATGSMAQVSRMVLPALGSKLVYGYLDHPAAPGQPSMKEIDRLLTHCGVV